MAIDYVSILRSAPSWEDSIDSALVLAAGEASFLKANTEISAAPGGVLLQLNINRPVKVIASVIVSGLTDVALSTPVGGPVDVFVVDYFGGAGSATAVRKVSSLDIFTVTDKAVVIEGRFAPKHSLGINSTVVQLRCAAAAGIKLLAGSYIKIL